MKTRTYTAITPDVTEHNEAYNISKAELKTIENTTVAAFSWLASASDGRLPVLKLILNKLAGKSNRYTTWLLIGDSCWKPRNRITQYYKLWGSLSKRGLLDGMNGNRTDEVMVESVEGIKFFAALKMSELTATSIIPLVEVNFNSYVVCLPEKISIDNIIATGWENEQGVDVPLLKRVVESDGILIKSVGHFDDREKGFVGFGTESILKNLNK